MYSLSDDICYFLQKLSVGETVHLICSQDYPIEDKVNLVSDLRHWGLNCCIVEYESLTYRRGSNRIDISAFNLYHAYQVRGIVLGATSLKSSSSLSLYCLWDDGVYKLNSRTGVLEILEV